MALGFETTIQGAINAKLKASTALVSAAAGGIYDSVPQNAAYPFIVVGEDRHTDESTDTGIRRRVRVQIDTWSRFRGREEVKSLQYLIELALNRATLSLTGYEFIGMHFVSSDSFVDIDELTRHGVQEFEIIIKRI